MEDKPGMISCLSKEISEMKGNIISLVTREWHEKNKRKLSVKVTGISVSQFEKILEKIGVEAEDLRVV